MQWMLTFQNSAKNSELNCLWNFKVAPSYTKLNLWCSLCAILNRWASFISLSPACEGDASSLFCRCKKRNTTSERVLEIALISSMGYVTRRPSPFHGSWISCKISGWFPQRAAEFRSSSHWGTKQWDVRSCSCFAAAPWLERRAGCCCLRCCCPCSSSGGWAEGCSRVNGLNKCMVKSVYVMTWNLYLCSWNRS